MNFRIHRVLALFLFVSPFFLVAQSAKTDFEKAVADWNQLRTMRSETEEAAPLSKG